MAQETVILVDIQRSTEGKVFETELYVKQFDKLKKAGKLGDWRLKSDIESIKTNEVEADVEVDTVEIIQLDEDPSEEIVEETQEILDIRLLNLGELQSLCTEMGIKFHHAAKESNLIKKLQEAGL